MNLIPPSKADPQCSLQESKGAATPTEEEPRKTPTSKVKTVPVWERLYGAETESTARHKAFAQSGEKKINVFSFSGSGGKMSQDPPSAHRIRTPRATSTSESLTPSSVSSTKSQGARTPGGTRVNTPKSTHSAGTKNGDGKTPLSGKAKHVPVWERLYGTDTESTARHKVHPRPGEKVKVFSFSGSGGKKIQ